MKSFIIWALCLVLSALLFASAISFPVLAEAIPTQLKLGGQSEIDPLQLTIFADGDLLTAVYQPEQPLSTLYAYIPQYKVIRPFGQDLDLIEWGSQLTFTAGSQEKALYHNRYYGYSGYDSLPMQRYPFGQASLSGSADRVTASWDLSEHPLQLTQEVWYQPGSWSFQISWRLVNNGDSTFYDLSFIHGGDTDLYGDDRSRADWDLDNQRLLLWPQDPWDSGLMLMGSQDDPAAAHFYGGSYQQLLYNASQPVLPDTVEAQFQECGLQLQWQKSSLQPGESWHFTAWQQFTPPGDIQIITPQPQTAAPGSQIELDFLILYIGDPVSRPELSQESTSQSGWTWQGQWSAAADLSGEPGGFARPLSLQTVVPDDAADGWLESVELIIRHSYNPWTDYRASGYVLVDSSLAEELPALPTPLPTRPAEPDQPGTQVTTKENAAEPGQTGQETKEDESETGTSHSDKQQGGASDSSDPTVPDKSRSNESETEVNPDTRDQTVTEPAEASLYGADEPLATRVLATLSLSLLAILIILMIRQQRNRDKSE